MLFGAGASGCVACRQNGQWFNNGGASGSAGASAKLTIPWLVQTSNRAVLPACAHARVCDTVGASTIKNMAHTASQTTQRWSNARCGVIFMGGLFSVMHAVTTVVRLYSSCRWRS